MSKIENPDPNIDDTFDEERKKAALEEKVRAMLDPEIRDLPDRPAQKTDSVKSAPELPDDSSAEQAVSNDPKPAEHTGTKGAVDSEPAPVDRRSASVEPESGPATDETPLAEGSVAEKLAPSQEPLTVNDSNNEPKPLTRQPAAPATKPAKGGKLKRAIRKWWRTAWMRNLSFAILFLIGAAVMVVPQSRYFTLNLAGVRSSASLVVLDDSSQQPLKNVQVSLGGETVRTDDRGRVQFSDIRLGQQTLQFERRAYAELERDITIGWGSNPLGEFKLSPTGSQYVFRVTDYLSGKPLTDIEAVSDEYSAVSDDQGEIKLTMDISGNQATAMVSLSGDGLRQEHIELNLTQTDAIAVSMVTDRPHYFVSKRTGQYDVYQVDVDGKNEVLLLEGSGSEREDLVLAPHPNDSLVALVSTRENVRNSQGFLLNTLVLIDPGDQIPVKLAQSERIQIIDWIDDNLVYVVIGDGESAVDPERHKLISHNVTTGESKQLATANFFNDVAAVNGAIYYAPSQAHQSADSGLHKVSADGSSRQKIMDEEAWNILRTDYHKLVIASGRDWYDYHLGESKLNRLSGQPADIASRVYTNNSTGSQAVWVDQRDGQGYMLAVDTQSSATEKVLYKQPGLQYPVRWLSDSMIVFRVSTNQEVADYALSLDGGEPRKIIDVTDTSGIEKWYYY